MLRYKDFISHEKFTDLMEGQVYPVILSNNSGDEHYTHFGVGTAFVLEHESELFVVTAQHVLNNQGATHDDVRILLRKAPISIIFDQRAVFRDESDPDADSDLVILRVKKSQHEALLAAGLTYVKAVDSIKTKQNPDVDLFHVYGYPDQGRDYDWDKKSLSAELWCLSGKLTTPSVKCLDTIQILNERSERPADLNGMSGSMVIADINDEWKFAGLVTLGGNEAGVLSFIPAEQILYYLDKMICMELFGLVQPADA
ncbi:hypothetical protein [Pseudomonas putida]